MTVSVFIMLLSVFSAVTGLVTEAVKRFLDELFDIKYSSNLIAVIVAFVVGICGTTTYYVLFNIPTTAVNVVCVVLMGAASAVGAMVGYDKVVQMIKQIRGGQGSDDNG